MRRCRNPDCRLAFEPRNSLQVVCGPACAIAYGPTAEAQRAAAAQRRRERSAYRVAHESLAAATRKAQGAFNRYIRARDRGLPCISCGCLPDDRDLLTGSRMDAGHYRSTGACPQLRFEPDNCHMQCVRCNRNLSGNSVAYRIGLLARIGPERLEWLEGPHPLPKWMVSDLRAIESEYKTKRKELAQ